ncbi:integral membrane protein [Moelleriella libera RCEF 2490]|uniref:Integral membrane protein n=1 Tax=Moelleriella libera RCEF 2490 TaxID=1081109 RepID=A0A166V075_9HYPO|nr:integral membrane protein [Moelleriella libera RCEF 2490]
MSQSQLSPEEALEDQSPQLLAVAITFTILPLVSVALRFAARKVSRQTLWFDDWLVIVGAALSVAQLAFFIKALHYGFGKHGQVLEQNGQLHYLEGYFMYIYLGELWFVVDVTLSKLSVLCLYLRIFRVDRRFRLICYTVMGVVISWGVAVFFATMLQCLPIRGAWKVSEPGRNCIRWRAYFLGTSVSNIVTDATVIGLSVPMLWKLQLSVSRKIGLIILFLIAATTTIISIGRCYYGTTATIEDPTWNWITVAVLTTVEANVAICCACMPVVYPLFRVLIGRRRSTFQRSHENAGEHSSYRLKRLASRDWAAEGRSLVTDNGDQGSISASSQPAPKDGIMVRRDYRVTRTGVNSTTEDTTEESMIEDGTTERAQDDNIVNVHVSTHNAV